MPSPWTEPAIALLQSISAQKSASEIALTLRDEFNIVVTRSAVIGMCHRKRFPMRTDHAPQKITTADGRPVLRRKSPARIAAEARQRIERMQSRPLDAARNDADWKPIDDDLKIPLAQRRLIHELRGEHCKWPVGDPGTKDFFFCGGERVKDAPYCAGHCSVAYRPPEQRRRAA